MFKKIITLCIIASIVTPITWSNDSENSLLREEVKLLKQKLSELEQRLTAQETKAVETDRIVSTLPADIKKEINFDALEKKDRMAFLEGFGAIKDNYDFVSISGNIDVVGFYSDQNTVSAGQTAPGSGIGFAREDTSDIIIDQVRLNFDIDVSENVKAFIGLQFEDYQTAGNFNFGAGGAGGADTETDNDLQIDEAYISIGGDNGMYTILGKQYMPFGNVTDYGNFINDTLTRQLYETRDTGAVVGMKNENMDFSVFAFNGPTEETRINGSTTDNQLDAWGASLAFTSNDEDQNMKFGISYLNNIYQAQNSLGLSLPTSAAVAAVAVGAPLPPSTYNDDDNGALNLYSVITLGPLTLNAEWVTAINDLDRNLDGMIGTGTNGNELGLNGDTDVKPQAYTVELSMKCPMADKEYTFAVKYEASNDFEDFNGTSIQDIFGVGISSNIYENTRLTLNYENWDYVDIVSGTGGGGHANVFLAELSISF